MSLNPFNPVHPHIQELLNLSSKAFGDDDFILVKNETTEEPLQGIYSVKITKDHLVVEHYDRWFVKIPFKNITNSSYTNGNTIGLMIDDPKIGQHWIWFELYDLKELTSKVAGFVVQSDEIAGVMQSNYRSIAAIKAVTKKRRIYVSTRGDKQRIYPISLNGKQRLLFVNSRGEKVQCFSMYPITRNNKDNHGDFEGLLKYFKSITKEDLFVIAEIVGGLSSIDVRVHNVSVDTYRSDFVLEGNYGRFSLRINYRDLSPQNAYILTSESGRPTFIFELKKGIRFSIHYY